MCEFDKSTNSIDDDGDLSPPTSQPCKHSKSLTGSQYFATGDSLSAPRLDQEKFDSTKVIGGPDSSSSQSTTCRGSEKLMDGQDTLDFDRFLGLSDPLEVDGPEAEPLFSHPNNFNIPLMENPAAESTDQRSDGLAAAVVAPVQSRKGGHKASPVALSASQNEEHDRFESLRSILEGPHDQSVLAAWGAYKDAFFNPSRLEKIWGTDTEDTAPKTNRPTDNTSLQYDPDDFNNEMERLANGGVP